VLYLRTLGALRLDHPASSVLGVVNQRRPLTLLAYLAAVGEFGAPRERLLAVFWPDTDVDSARGALKQHVFALRKATGESELILGRDQLRLNRDLIRTDVDDFVAAARSGRTEELLELYRGPFLDGIQGGAEFDEWVGRERRRFAEMFEAALDRRLIELGAHQDSAPAGPAQRAATNEAPRTRRQLGPRSSNLRYAIFGALCGMLATVAGMNLHRSAPRYDTLVDVVDSRRAAHKNDRRPRGRLFIETPMNMTGRKELSVAGEAINSALRGIVGDVGDITLVPQDSVRAIERAVSNQPGLAGPGERLSLANSSMNVLTVYTLRSDSLNIDVRLQRIVFPPSSRSAASWWRTVASAPARRRAQIETWTVAYYKTGIAKPNVAIAATRLVHALRAMRSCDLNDHRQHELTPWCWQRENQPGIVPGYFEIAHPVALYR
jgi:hypothetical protein